MPSLFVIQGRDQGRRFEFTEGTVSVGRESGNTIQLYDTEVSRQHGELSLHENIWALEDLNSSNGTYVNGKRVSQIELRSGDQVQFGRTLLLFTAASDASSLDRAGAIDIVTQGVEDDSRILHSLTPEQGSQIFDAPSGNQSPWLARARSNLQVMYRTALAVSHTLDIDELLARIMQLIFEWVEADRGCVMLVDQQSGELTPRARRNRKAVNATEKIQISKTILDYVMQHTEGVLTSDARADDRFNAAASVVQMGIREAIAVPMQGRYGVVGVIYIDTYTEPQRVIQSGGANKFNEEHLKLMVAIAHQAALAVEDTSYYSAMVQAERLAAVGQTIASLSHHIKNILQGIRGGSYLIDMGLSDNDPEIVRKGWHIVEKNQTRISNLVLDMLTFSKEREPQLMAAHLNEVIGDVVELMQARADEFAVNLIFEPQNGIGEFQFDPEGIHRAALNIVTNAIDACEGKPEGTVTISTLLDDQQERLRVEIRDNGVGMSDEQVKNMFTIFVSTKGSKGTGLGLSVSQKILQEHGGQITVTSKLGLGSCFTLELPATPVTAEGEPKDSDSSVYKTIVP